MQKKLSIRDIAKLTNTSITTVSLVLNGKGRISDEVKKRILDVASKNGYEPNRMAVGLRTGVSKVIGLIVESIGGPFFGAMAKVIEHEAEQAGYGIIYGSTNNNIQKGKDIIKMLSNQLVDGYIITPIKGLEKDIQKLIDNNKPVVLIDGYFPGLDIAHVLVDNYSSVYNATEHLVRSDYKNIAFITPDLDLIQLHDRMKGYKDAIKNNGLKADSKLIFKLPFDTEKKEAVDAVKTFITQHKKIDAIFFATNYLGTIGLQSISELKLEIPSDLAVISFDDNELFELFPPGITAIKQPTYDIAKSAIDALLLQLNNSDTDIAAIQHQIPSNFIERGSTKRRTS
ncbi:LacI family DNA-binding transcriptional regulator [Mucilaginibacter sp. Bleaf8]|nr:LacI family DNA-binding transcriptional regulator [Mucilaginibacter sp. Bleaf8]